MHPRLKMLLLQPRLAGLLQCIARQPLAHKQARISTVAAVLSLPPPPLDPPSMDVSIDGTLKPLLETALAHTSTMMHNTAAAQVSTQDWAPARPEAPMAHAHDSSDPSAPWAGTGRSVAGSGVWWLVDKDGDDERAAAEYRTAAAVMGQVLDEEQAPEEPWMEKAQFPASEGGDVTQLVDFVYQKMLPCSVDYTSGGFMGYVGTAGLLESAVADFIVAAATRHSGLHMIAPGLTAFDMVAVQWLCGMVGYDAVHGGAGGVLLSGGSLANLQAVHCARVKLLGDDGNLRKATIYTSLHSHVCVADGAYVCGFPKANVRKIPLDDCFRVRTDLLQEAITKDIANGYTPMMAVGVAGSTNTGAVDDLETLAEVAQQHSMWFHVDGAYGGLYGITEAGGRTLQGMAAADSVAVDPHKSMFLSFGTGALLVRCEDDLLRACGSTAAYLQSTHSLLPPDPCQLSVELTKPVRGLRVWLAVKLHGLQRFREHLKHKMDLAMWAAEALERVPNVTVLHKPQLSTFVFKWEPQRGDDRSLTPSQLDDWNRQFLVRINSYNRVFLTPLATVTGRPEGGEFCVRMCLVSARITTAHVQAAVEDIAAAAAWVTQQCDDASAS